MKAEYVELVLLEQSLANTYSMNRPFSDRVDDVAEKTGGSVLFDVRVDGDPRIRRMAAIGYDANDPVVAIVLDKDGQLRSAPVDADSDLLVAELTVWGSLPMGQQASATCSGAATALLAKLSKLGRFDRPT